MSRSGKNTWKYFGRKQGSWLSHVKRAPKEERTYKGRTYASKAERSRAVQLDVALRAGAIRSWKPQVTFDLGPCMKYRADFVVEELNGERHAEEVKGFEDERARRVKRFWAHYGTMRLVILHQRDGHWKKEYVNGKGGNDDHKQENAEHRESARRSDGTVRTSNRGTLRQHELFQEDRAAAGEDRTRGIDGPA